MSRFLAVLAAGCASGRIGELSTGAGIGAAWIASAVPANCVLITAEIDERLAVLARELLAEDPRIEVITGDALHGMAGRGPFDLLYADSGIRDDAHFGALVSLLRIGGHILMDDLTPEQVHSRAPGGGRVVPRRSGGDAGRVRGAGPRRCARFSWPCLGGGSWLPTHAVKYGVMASASSLRVVQPISITCRAKTTLPTCPAPT